MKSDFFGGLAPRTDKTSLYPSRRKELVEFITSEFPDKKNGIVVLFAAFEQGNERFRQDKTFYYYTGINEPGTVLVIDMTGKSTLYLPNCFEKRAQWMTLPEAGTIAIDAAISSPLGWGATGPGPAAGDDEARISST